MDDWRYRYDALGRLSQIQMVRRNGVAVDIDPYTTGIQPELTGYHYDLAGNLDWQDQPTGVQTDYTYDALQRLTPAPRRMTSRHATPSTAFVCEVPMDKSRPLTVSRH